MSSISLRRLDWKPGSTTRPARWGGWRMVGVLVLDPAPFAGMAMLSAIQAAARDADYLVSIVDVPVADRRSALAAVTRLRHLAAEGILLIAPRGDAVAALIEAAGELPVVGIAAGPHDGVTTVTVDHYGGAVAATRHLLGLGNRTVFHVSGPWGQHDSSRRLAGWRDSLLEVGAEVPPPLVGDWSPACGYRLGCRLGLRAEVSAIFVAGDQMALGVLRALHELERRVPDDVDVVGFDCLPHGEFFTPPLTTVRQDFAQVGWRGFELLRDEIERGRRATNHHTIPSELIVRASTTTAARGVTSNALTA